MKLTIGNATVKVEGSSTEDIFNALLYVTSGVQVVQISGGIFHPEQIVHQGVERKFPDPVFGGT